MDFMMAKCANLIWEYCTVLQLVAKCTIKIAKILPKYINKHATGEKTLLSTGIPMDLFMFSGFSEAEVIINWEKKLV